MSRYYKKGYRSGGVVDVTVVPIADDTIRWKWYADDGALWLDIQPLGPSCRFGVSAGHVDSLTARHMLEAWGYQLWLQISPYVSIVQPELIRASSGDQKSYDQKQAERMIERIVDAFMPEQIEHKGIGL